MIIDDDSRYVEPQKDLAYNEFGLNLIHYKTWEEAQAELIDNFKAYDAIIVDGKGQLNKDSKAEDDSHLFAVISWLKQEKGRGQIVPIFINTGFQTSFLLGESPIPTLLMQMGLLPALLYISTLLKLFFDYVCIGSTSRKLIPFFAFFLILITQNMFDRPSTFYPALIMLDLWLRPSQ
jgi:hypothetical protein